MIVTTTEILPALASGGLTGIVAAGMVTLAALLPALPIRPALAYGLGALTYPLYLLHQHIGYATFTRFAGSANR